MPGGGIPRLSGEEDGDAGSLPMPACLGHRGNSGGGKPPTPTVHPMRHAAPLDGTEQQAPCHIPVCQESGSKEAADSGGEAEGEPGTGL